MSEFRDIESVNLSLSERNLIEKGWGADVLNNVNVSKVVYNSDGFLVEGYSAKPNDAGEKKYPLILWNRGGDEKSGKLDDFLASGILGEIASWGFIVIASQYRNNDEFGGKEINDVLNILKIGMSLPYFDGENIGVEGWSRGGMMTYQLLTKINFFKCAAVVAGLADPESNFERNKKLKEKFYSLFRNADVERIREEISKRAAVDFYEKISPETPLLLIHGTSDDKVSYNDSLIMHSKLSKIKRAEIQLETIENGDHYLSKDRERVKNIRKKWFNKYLKLNN